MYRRPKFLEVLLDIRRQMAKEADYDVVLFAENARSGKYTVEGGTAEGMTENVNSADVVEEKSVNPAI